jgi:ABC-2 type transport system permease protein
MELLGGKILGIAGVGLTQYAVWTGLALLGGGSGIAMARSQMGEVSVPMTTLVFCIVFFILGYLLYSTMYAALGAMVNSDQEGQQLQLLIVQFLIVPMLLMMPVLRAPNGTLATVLSLIPFYTPILMLLRISLVMPPVWQVALSIALLLLTNLGVLWVSARIYRVGILMYGKRPTLPELVRWVRAA